MLPCVWCEHVPLGEHQGQGKRSSEEAASEKGERSSIRKRFFDYKGISRFRALLANYDIIDHSLDWATRGFSQVDLEAFTDQHQSKTIDTINYICQNILFGRK